MADVKISGLPNDTSLDTTHYIPLVDPTGTPTTKRTTLATFMTWLQSVSSWVKGTNIDFTTFGNWFLEVPGVAFISVIAGTWVYQGANTGTGNGGGFSVQSNGAQNEEVTYKIFLNAGTYRCFVLADKDVNRGIYTITLNGSSIGTGDGYNGSRISDAKIDINAALVIATSAVYTMNVKMATKNASSAGYYAVFRAVEFVRTA